MNKLTKEQCAYIAGIVDGEGTISISHNNIQGKNSYSIVMRVYNTDKKLINWLCKKTGLGAIKIQKNAVWERNNIKVLYKWDLYANNIRQFLPLIEPYLIIKKKQAQIMIEWLSKPRLNGYSITDERRKYKKEMCIKMLKLNRRGKHIPSLLKK
jgi:hypothetical protein